MLDITWLTEFLVTHAEVTDKETLQVLTATHKKKAKPALVVSKFIQSKHTHSGYKRCLRGMGREAGSSVASPC